MSAATIKVWPTKATAVDLKHPHAPPLALGGVDWPVDTFTMRRLRDGAATEDGKKAFVPEKGEPAGTGAPPEPAKG